MSRAGWIILAGATIALAIAGPRAAAAHEDKGCSGRVVVRDRIVVSDRDVIRTRIVIPRDVWVLRLQDDDPDTRAVLERTGRTVGRAIGRGIGRTIGRMLGRDAAVRRAPGVDADLLFDLHRIEGSV